MATERDKISYGKRGVSLLELLIYIAVFSVIVVFMASMFPLIVRSRAAANARFETQENLRFAVEKIQQAAYDASSVTLSGTCPLNVVEFGGATNISFRISGGILQIQEGGANPFKDITSASVTAGVPDVGDCLFSRIDNPSPAKSTVRVKIKVGYNDGGRDELKFSDSAQITISLR